MKEDMPIVPNETPAATPPLAPPPAAVTSVPAVEPLPFTPAHASPNAPGPEADEDPSEEAPILADVQMLKQLHAEAFLELQRFRVQREKILQDLRNGSLKAEDVVIKLFDEMAMVWLPMQLSILRSTGTGIDAATQYAASLFAETSDEEDEGAESYLTPEDYEVVSEILLALADLVRKLLAANPQRTDLQSLNERLQRAMTVVDDASSDEEEDEESEDQGEEED